MILKNDFISKRGLGGALAIVNGFILLFSIMGVAALCYVGYAKFHKVMTEATVKEAEAIVQAPSLQPPVPATQASVNGPTYFLQVKLRDGYLVQVTPEDVRGFTRQELHDFILLIDFFRVVTNSDLETVKNVVEKLIPRDIIRREVGHK